MTVVNFIHLVYSFVIFICIIRRTVCLLVSFWVIWLCRCGIAGAERGDDSVCSSVSCETGWGTEPYQCPPSCALDLQTEECSGWLCVNTGSNDGNFS